MTADFLRSCGEKEWARTVVQAADGLRKQGWTDAGKGAVEKIFCSDPSLGSVTFGTEHGRWLGGETGQEEANKKFSILCQKIRDLMTLDTRELPAIQDRKRSPDLIPLTAARQKGL